MELSRRSIFRIVGIAVLVGCTVTGYTFAGRASGSAGPAEGSRRGNQGQSLVVEAARDGDVEAVHSLLAIGEDVNARQGDGATALHWAVHRNDTEAITTLLEAGADVNAANALGATPLWLAATNGKSAVVRRLLQEGANPNVALQRGETPLMSAARSGDLETVSVLLGWGAAVDQAEHERGQTALMWAVAQRHADVALALVAGGADLSTRTRVWRQLENTAGNTNPIGNFRMAHGGSTPLLFAARNGDIATARVLVEAGTSVDDVSAAGMSALVIAAHSGHGALATYLLQAGADPNTNDAGYTALHAAVLRGQTELTRSLLEHGADIDATVAHGTPGRRFSADYSIRHQAVGANAFWLAAKYGELDILRILAEHGADPFVRPENGVSSLQATMGRPAISQENRRNRVGVPLSEANVQEELVRQLAEVVLSLGVDVNEADQGGDTALHDAVRTGLASVVEFLAIRGANVQVRNNRDQTALGLAETPLPVPGTNGRRATRPRIAELLRSFGAGE